MDPVVVIGTGLAGFNLVKEFRKLDPDTPVVMLSADDGRNYSKPMLSNALARHKQPDDLALGGPEQTAAALGVTVRPGTMVTAIDRERRALTLDSGETLPWQRLVLALGAEVIRPALEGDALDAVCSVNDLMDYARFRQALEGRRTVLIMGGGLIGCEFANDLIQAGYRVHLVEPMGRCLPTLLPEAASQAVGDRLAQEGVVFHFGPFVQRVDRHGEGILATLSDGSTVEADLVLSAVGLRPRTALAREAGLAVARGIVTDRFLRTSDDRIHALGDCAEVNGHLLFYLLPLMASARALARTLTGTETAVGYGPMPVTIKTPACPVVCLPPPRDITGHWQVEADGHHVKALFHDEEGQLRGFALTGEACSERMALSKSLPNLF